MSFDTEFVLSRFYHSLPNIKLGNARLSCPYTFSVYQVVRSKERPEEVECNLAIVEQGRKRVGYRCIRLFKLRLQEALQLYQRLQVERSKLLEVMEPLVVLYWRHDRLEEAESLELNQELVAVDTSIGFSLVAPAVSVRELLRLLTTFL